MSICWHTPAMMILQLRGAIIMTSLMRPGAPTHSKMNSGAWPAIASTCGIRGLAGSTASVAPKRAAIFARKGARSLTMTWRAPRNFAQSMTARPTGPAPITSTVAPRGICALSTACSPTASGSTIAPSRKLTTSGSRWAPLAPMRTYSA